MKTVSTAELKARLGKYLGMVREGETVYVTSHRRTVARLVPGEAGGSPGIQAPTIPMQRLKDLKGIRPAREAAGWEALVDERRRR